MTGSGARAHAHAGARVNVRMPSWSWRARFPWLALLREDVEPHVEEGLRQSVMRSLRFLSLGLAGVYFTYAFVHVFTLPPLTASMMALLSAASALAFVVLHLQLARGNVSSHYAHDLAWHAFNVLLINGLAHLALVKSPLLTTNLILAIVGAGLVFLSWKWLAASAGMTLGAWSVVAVDASWTTEWAYFGFGLVSATLLSFFVFAVRINAIERIETIRLLDARHQRELARALEQTGGVEGHLSRVVDSAPAVVLSLHPDGRVAMFGGRTVGPFDIPSERALGRPAVEVWERHPHVAHAAKRALAGEESTRVVDHADRRLRMHWAPVRNHVGHVIGATAVVMDVTAEAEALDARTRGAAKLRQLEYARDLERLKVSAVLAHLPRLRHAYDALRDSLVERAGETDEELDPRLFDIERNLATLEAAARLDERHTSFGHEPVDLASLATTVVKSRLSAASRAHVAIELRGGDVPPTLGDEARLREALETLLDNALEFTPAAGRVVVTTRREGNGVVLEVADSGPALPAADAACLAAPWEESLQRTPTSERGRRLSLLVARRVVERHGGRLSALPGVSRSGSTFRIDLPAAA